MTKEELRELVETHIQKVNLALAKLDDSSAIDMKVLFQRWVPGRRYTEGQRLRYGDKLYSVKQTHISSIDQTPDIASDLFAEITK